MTLHRKVIVSAALSGAVTGREHTPAVPLTPAEVAEDARRCEAAGAAIVHVHVRATAADGAIRLGADAYRELVAAVRASSRALVSLSTSSWHAKATIADRVAAVEAGPDLVSFHVASFNRGDTLFHNPVEYQDALAGACLTHGIKPEFELFDLAHVSRALDVQSQYGLPEPFYAQFVLGCPGGCPAEPGHLQHLAGCLPPNSVWSVAAVGAAQLPMNLMGLLLGGHVRTGLEDNVFLRNGVRAGGNAELVERIVAQIRELDLDVASPAEARSLLGLEAR